MPVITTNNDSLSIEDITQFEDRFAIRLPVEYRSFLLANNGGEPMPRGFSTEDGKVRSMVSRFFPMYDPEEFALDDEYSEISLDGLIPSHLLPIAIDPAENRVLLSLSGDDCGAVYYWSWDEEPDPASCSYKYMRRVAPNFEMFFMNLK